MKRISVAVALVAAITASSGCSVASYVRTKIRVRHAACDAWICFNERNECIAHDDDVEDGFKEGYREFVYRGCPGPCPDLPCKYHRYWYQTCFGRQEIEAWREGYQFGQSVASQECLGRGACGSHGCGGGCPGPAGGPGCSCGQNGGMQALFHTGMDGMMPPQALAEWQSAEAVPVPTEAAPAPKATPDKSRSLEDGAPALPMPPAPQEPAPPQADFHPGQFPIQVQAPATTQAPPSAQLELPAPTAQEVTPEEAAKDPPQAEVPARNSSFGPVQLRSPAGTPYAPATDAEFFPAAPPAGAPTGRGPQLMTPTDVPTTYAAPGPATIEAPAAALDGSPAMSRPNVPTPPISFGMESPKKVSVSSDPFAAPAPSSGQMLPANRGWKPMDWKPTRSSAPGQTGSFQQIP